MEYVISLFSEQIIIIAAAIFALLWGISRTKVAGKPIGENNIWLGIRPIVAIALGAAASMLPGVFDTGDGAVGIPILKGMIAGFIGALLLLAGVAKRILNKFSKK